MLTITLIIDQRREMPAKYKKILEDDTNHTDIINDIPKALQYIQDNEPDLIIISDTIKYDLSKFCHGIRVLTYNMRPIIVAVSKSSEIQDKIKILESGADDYISEPIDAEEFKIRMKAHLRREYESVLDTQTGLPLSKYCYRALKRILVSPKNWGCLLTGIENFYSYKETYSEIASNKLLQTYTAIISSALDKNDFFGLLNDRDLLVITNSTKIEKLASFMTFAFDTVKNKFYSDEDLERGYIMVHGDESSEKKSGFVYAITGGITNEIKRFTSPEDIIHELRQIYEIAKRNNKSSYLIEHPKLSGTNSIVEKKFNNRIAILEEDNALSLLLTTALNLKGYKTEIISKNFDIEKFLPALVILDTGNDEKLNGLEFCKKIKKNYPEIKTITTSIFHDKETIMNAGTDIYLPKPYTIDSLLKWVNLAIKEFND